MSASLLREAAAKMRVDQDIEHQLGHIDQREYETWLAVADWLENSAESLDAWGEIGVADLSVADMYAHEIKVATAYLGSADD